MGLSEEISSFVQRTPWAIDGKLQPNMLRTLENERGRLAQVQKEIKFSLLTPMYNTSPRHLRELIWSCQAQSWENWELILVDDGSPSRDHLEVAVQASRDDIRIKFIQAPKNGGISHGRNVGLPHTTGDYVGILDHDDLLHPQALGIFGRQLLDSSPRPTFIFSNECKITDDSTLLSDFFYKPRFCKSTLLRSNYIAHLTFVQRDLLMESSIEPQKWYRSEFDGVEDHEFFLRLSDHPKFLAAHIPLFTYLWRKAPTSTSTAVSAKPYVYDRGKKMIGGYLSHRKVDFTEIHSALTRGENRFFQVRLKKSDLSTPVLVMPFKDQAAMTIICLESIERQTVPSKIVLVDNGSRVDELQKVQGWLQKTPRKHTYVLESYPGAFDYAAMNNQNIKKHAGSAEYVGFLNNDIELLSETTFEQMLAELSFNGQLGFVGIRLWYPGKIETQHGGIKFGPARSGSGYLRPTHIQTDRDFASDEHCVSAVTFALCFCRKKLWQQLDGLEERWLPNGMGDVDICLRAYRAGYQNFYLGSVDAIHHESKTRSTNDEDLELFKLHELHAKEILELQTARLEYDSFEGLQGNESMKPLRYRVVDRLNAILKQWLRPAHGLTKRLLTKG